MEINIWILIAQSLNFLLILLLFKVFVWDKITKAIQARRAELAKADDATKAFQETVEKAQQEKKLLLEEALAHKNKILDEAHQAAQLKAEAVLDDAEKKARSTMSQAQERADKIEKDLQDSFVDAVKQTTNLVVKKLFDKDVALQEDYINTLVSERKK